jgi:hypothetical protein
MRVAHVSPNVHSQGKQTTGRDSRARERAVHSRQASDQLIAQIREANVGRRRGLRLRVETNRPAFGRRDGLINQPHVGGRCGTR